MEQITSAGNRWVKLVGRLKIKKYRDKNRQFLMEGLRSAEDALAQGYRDAVCFLTEEARRNKRVEALIENAAKYHWLFLEVTEPLMQLIAGTEHGQGIMLILQKKPENVQDLLQPLHGHYVLLDGVQDPGNMGTIFRTAAAAGCKGILLTEGCTDPFAEKVVRSSMGSILRMPVYEKLTPDILEQVRNISGLKLIGTALENGIAYRKCGPFPDAIFVFGNEGNGIRSEILALCDQRLYIPMASGVESLNVSASAAILLFYFKEETA
jgi:RNA methyltransferase, trmH family